jgi:hypothetical protein
VSGVGDSERGAVSRAEAASLALRSYLRQQSHAPLALNPISLFIHVESIERGCKPGDWRTIFEAAVGQAAAAELYSAAEKHLCGGSAKQGAGEAIRFVLDDSRAQLSVKMALDRLWLVRVGFIAAPDGDLRRARLLSSQEQALNLLRWRAFRNRQVDSVHTVIHDAINAGDSKFLRRLSDLIAQPPREIPVGPDTTDAGDRFRFFLLGYWAREVKLPRGGFAPPLYTFTDVSLLEYLQLLHDKADGTPLERTIEAVMDMDARSLRTCRERLGLFRPGTGTWRHVTQPDRGRRTLEIGKVIRLFDHRPVKKV